MNPCVPTVPTGGDPNVDDASQPRVDDPRQPTPACGNTTPRAQIAPTNSFCTSQTRPSGKPKPRNSIAVKLASRPCGFPIGLTSLDIDRSTNIRIDAFTDSVTEDTVNVHLDTWADTILYSAGCTWLEVCANDRDFQFGSFSTTDDHPWQNPKLATSRQIYFPRRYVAPPKVLVWLSGFELGKDHGWRIAIHATDITATSFIIHIDTWDDTALHSARATWIAFPSNRPNITMGSYNIMDVRKWDSPRPVNQGKITFDKPFQCTPRVLTALNTFDLSNNTNPRIKLDVEDVDSQGMTWNIDAWDDTVIYSAGASYLAIEDF